MSFLNKVISFSFSTLNMHDSLAVKLYDEL